VNEVIALLLDAGAALSDGMAPRFALDDLIAPPAVVLSHDCDVLNGNDYITQAIRIYRIFQPLGRGPSRNSGCFRRSLRIFSILTGTI
jgi:hypothetical protein